MDNSSNENVINLEQSSDMLTDLIRNHARQLIKEALELEVAEVLQEFKERRLADGRQAVCRSGYQPEREIQT
ncbi:MAG: IS256 family transposase, partial [Pseudomonadota bacterium]|nr:IS256 family transposase [Pseudomonadota bacterium]